MLEKLCGKHLLNVIFRSSTFSVPMHHSFFIHNFLGKKKITVIFTNHREI